MKRVAFHFNPAMVSTETETSALSRFQQWVKDHGTKENGTTTSKISEAAHNEFRTYIRKCYYDNR